MPDQSRRVYIIDTHSVIFQMFHGVGPMTAADGRPTNAVFGVVRDLMRIFDEVKPEYLLCAFDLPDTLHRETFYPAYKKNRTEPPSDLVIQIPIIRAVIEAMNIPVIGIPGYEADDVMATIAAASDTRGYDVAVCTADKDCRQLISDRVRLFNLRKQTWMDRVALKEDWDITPEQVVDYQTLIGDPTDNVPGVPGIGAKTAATLLNQYGTLDVLLTKIDEIKAKKTRENLQIAKDTGAIEISRHLVRLDRAVPIDFDWDGWERRDWNGPKLLELFSELGFRRYADRVRSTLRESGARRNGAILIEAGLMVVGPRAKPAGLKSDPTAGDGSLFADVPDDLPFTMSVKPVDNWKGDYKLVATPEAFETFFAELSQRTRFAIDLETTGLNPIAAEIVGMAFSWAAETGYYLALRGPEGEIALDPVAAIERLRPILEDPGIAKVNQNMKYDLLVFRSRGIDLRGIVGDSMIAHYLLHSGDRAHGLDDMTRSYFQHENIPISSLIGKGKKQIRMDQVSVASVSDYACEDADAAWRLTELLESQLEASGVRSLYDDVEIPLIGVLADLELAGIRLDVPLLSQLSEEMAVSLAAIEKDIYATVGKTFNLNSPKQLREILFDELKLPVQKRTGTTNEASTDQESLERLAKLDHPSAGLPKKMVEYRQISKLKGTYVDALPLLIDPQTGRVHTSFNQTVTSTGRLSSSDPNLQNIPTRSDLGQRIRQAFLPEIGWLLLAADYSQIELRLLAHFARDEAMQKAFAEDRDIHASVAAGINNVPEAEVTSAMRRIAKTVNFGVIYGMSARGLGDRLEIPYSEADKFIRDYFERFPKVQVYQDDLLRRCKSLGYVDTILGRRRRFDRASIDEKSSWRNRSTAEREAINMEIQGSAADLMKLAMLAVSRRLAAEKRRARMLLSVHDEIVLEVPPEEVDAVAALVRSEMEGAMTLSVPLRVDVGVGPNWLEMVDRAKG